MIFPTLALDQVNRATRTLDGAAGKSINVAKVLQDLGAKPFALTFLGGPRGDQLLALLQKRGVDIEAVTVAAPTRECVTVIDEAAGTITELVEESQPVAAGHYDALLAMVERRLPGMQAVVMSGTIAQGGPAHLYQRCTQLAHQAGALTVIDASGAPLLEALTAGPYLVKPNRAELENTFGRQLRAENELVAAMRELQARGARRVVITAGSESALACDGEQLWRVVPPQIAALNPIGSGDAFTAAMAWRLIQGDALDQACRWGSAAGAANALTPMAGEVRREDVEALVGEVRVDRFQ